jgi:NAD(P)-dependent dehydrogenase (short-subunit alcohol dehydrogenase family)
MQSNPKQFDETNQQKFAALSGDYNPIHVDPVAARRLMFGQPVVHGLHTLMWLLDHALAGHNPIRIRTLKADFRNPVRLNENVFYSSKPTNDDQIKLEASSATARLVSAEVQWEPAGKSMQVPTEMPPAEPVHDVSREQISSAAGSVPLMFDRGLAAEMFPNLAAKLLADQFAALLASTRIVGMRVPGLHSLLNAVELENSADAKAEMTYSVEEFDPRFSRAIIRLRGAGLQGTATASIRPAPTSQASFSEISKHVKPAEFAGQRALVIGGSRGLGEIAVKQLAAGGAAVKFSYHLGEADAQRLASEVTAAGGSAESFKLDVRSETPKLDEICKNFPPTVLCYFSTPNIAGAPRGKFSSPLFHDLCRVYVDGFLRVFTIAQASGSLTSAMQPSSIAIEETPFGMTEYAAAKAAAENLINGLRKAYPKIRFHAPRWGRMPTDLTASIAEAEADDPLPAVLSALRETLGK